MATNRIETLDPALIRPGRIDRKIEFPLPDEKTKRRIFNIHTSRMTLAPDVNLAELIMAKDDLSGADIKVESFLKKENIKTFSFIHFVFSRTNIILFIALLKWI
jgi:AAA+ superfamily predicted ATPase